MIFILYKNKKIQFILKFNENLNYNDQLKFLFMNQLISVEIDLKDFLIDKDLKFCYLSTDKWNIFL